MFSKNDQNSDVKIIDFGVATIHPPRAPPLTAFAGSLRSVAPEVVRRSYDRACDLWSVGVTAYFLLTAAMPFDGPAPPDVLRRIARGAYRFPRGAAAELSAEARDFVDGLLQVDVRRRMTARVALEHPWLRGRGTRPAAAERPAAPSRQVASSTRRPRRQPGY